MTVSGLRTLRFRSIQTRLLVFLVGLMLVVQGVMFLAVTTANLRFVNRQVEDDLRVTGRIFERFVRDRSEQLMLSTKLLSGDFAFKQAYVSGDRGTLLSAVRNLQEHRIGADLMMIVDVDDLSVVIHTLRPELRFSEFPVPRLIETAEETGRPSSALDTVDGRLYLLVVVPLLAPEPVAWIAVGFLIDDRFTADFKQLTLTDVSFLVRRLDAGWALASSTLGPRVRRAAAGALAASGASAGDVFSLDVSSERYLTLAIPAGDGIRALLQRSLDQALAPFQRLYRALAALSITSLALSIAGVVFIARSITHPLRTLVDGTRRVAMGDYRHQIHLARRDEIGHLAGAFNQMTRGLAAFQRYVPTDLVRTLIAKGIESTPQARTATIMFTDIQGFTSIGERLSPERLVALLNDYFAVVTQPIEGHGGVITQYQGDAILAVFNVPSDDPEHAAHAVRAAIAIQQVLKDRVFAGGIRLVTRIGINTGRVVAGSVGSKERVNYTVHGDAVNLTARLEALNKDYGTRIIVSQSTADLAGDELAGRRIGEVAVRGKQESITLYAIG